MRIIVYMCKCVYACIRIREYVYMRVCVFVYVWVGTVLVCATCEWVYVCFQMLVYRCIFVTIYLRIYLRMYTIASHSLCCSRVVSLAPLALSLTLSHFLSLP